MNTRLNELMKRAMEPNGLEGLGGSYMELNPEKFAELIVKDICNKLEPVLAREILDLYEVK